MFIEIILESENHEITDLIIVLVIFLGLHIVTCERSRTHLGIQIQRYFNIKIMEKATRVLWS